jgi:hypothetical protein
MPLAHDDRCNHRASTTTHNLIALANSQAVRMREMKTLVTMKMSGRTAVTATMAQAGRRPSQRKQQQPGGQHVPQWLNSRLAVQLVTAGQQQLLQYGR